MPRILLVITALLPAVTALAAEKEAIPLPSGRSKPPAPDARCASEGPGFIYSPSSRTCVRIGGLVGVEVSNGGSSTLNAR